MKFLFVYEKGKEEAKMGFEDFDIELYEEDSYEDSGEISAMSYSWTCGSTSVICAFMTNVTENNCSC